MVSFYMKGEALSWYKWMFDNHQLSDWSSFTRNLELRFRPSTYENHQAELFKLRQQGTAAEYQASFEKLCNRVIGLTPEAILNCYISGLTVDIQHEIAVHKPKTISEAIGLSKLLEAKLKDFKPKFIKNFSHPQPNNSRNIPTTQSSTPKTTASPTTVNLNKPNNNTPPIRKMTSTQMQECRAQGLCFNCDEKFIPGPQVSSSPRR
jgi:hypothetical protein